MKKIFSILAILGLVLFPAPAFLKNGARVKAFTTVNAFVESKVSVSNSTVSANVSELLADLSQRVIIQIQLKDKSNQPLKDIKVELYSNRGEIDQIKAIKAQAGILSESEQAESNVTLTDESGIAIFRVSSTVPGEANFLPIADNIVELPQIKVKFLPLPFPTNVTISVEVPSFINPQGKIVLFKPTGTSIDKTNLINTGTEIKVPSSLFLIIILLVTLGPILILIIFYLIRKIRKTERKEAEYLEREQEYLKKQTELLAEIAGQKSVKEKSSPPS